MESGSIDSGSMRTAFVLLIALTLMLIARPVFGQTAVMSNALVLCDPTFPSITSKPRRDSSAATSISPANRLFLYIRVTPLTLEFTTQGDSVAPNTSAAEGLRHIEARVWSEIQLTSQFLPPSFENDCSKCGDLDFNPDQSNLT